MKNVCLSFGMLRRRRGCARRLSHARAGNFKREGILSGNCERKCERRFDCDYKGERGLARKCERIGGS